MGYSTEFKGEIKFKRELTASQLAEVREFLGEDCRDHPEWEGAENLYGVDLEFNEDFSGLRWNGMEKTYDMVNVVNMIIANTRKSIPDFGFTGMLNAQGEDYNDRWTLTFDKKGWAKMVRVPLAGKVIVTCPECGGEFFLEDAEQRESE